MNTQNIPSLADVIKTVTQEVTGEQLINTSIDNFSNNHVGNYALGRNVHGNNSLSANMNRSGQLGFNQGVAAPSFYSPLATATAFVVPNARREVYVWAQFWYDNEPVVAAAIDFYRDFPMSGFELECPTSYVKKYFEKLVKKLNFAKWLPLIAHEYYLRGDSFVVGSINCPECNGGNVNEAGEKCKHSGATWSSITVLDPNQIEVSTTFLDQEPVYFYRPTEDMMRVVAEKQPKDLYDALPHRLKENILANKPIKLEPEIITHFKHGASPFSPFGTSLLRRLYPILAYKDKLRQAQWLIAERHIIPIKHVKVGNKERPANEQDISNIQEQLMAVANDPVLTFITHDAVDYDFVGAAGKVLQLDQEFDHIMEELLLGLSLNKNLINGDGPSYASAQVGLLATAQRLERFRNELAHWIQEKIFKPVAMWNGFTTEGDRGEENYIYPTIKWDDLQLRDNSNKLQIMASLLQNGFLSNQTVVEELGINWDQEVERLRYEQAANFVNSPNVSNADSMMGGGYGGELTGGGMPPMPGMEGGAMSAMPTTGMGGAQSPPGAAGLGGPMLASVNDTTQAYVRVAEILSDVNQRIVTAFDEKVNIRMAGRQVKSEAEKGFIQSQRPATGRGILGPIPVEFPDDIFPLECGGPQDGGPLTYPLNRHAKANWVVGNTIYRPEEIYTFDTQSLRMSAKNKQQLYRFTDLETSLYKSLTEANIPYALFAQYVAGPSMEYHLDAAIPALKLGIEADSETYHNSPDKIAKDRRRDIELASQGWTVLRFTEDEIKERPQDIISVVIQVIKKIVNPKANGNKEEKTL